MAIIECGRRLVWREGAHFISASVEVPESDYYSYVQENVPENKLIYNEAVNQTLKYWFDDTELICQCSINHNICGTFWNGFSLTVSGSYSETCIIFIAHDLDEALVIYEKVELANNLTPYIDTYGDTVANGQSNLTCQLIKWHAGVETVLDSWTWDSDELDNCYIVEAFGAGDGMKYRAFVPLRGITVTTTEYLNWFATMPGFPLGGVSGYAGATFGPRSSFPRWNGDTSSFEPDTGGVFRHVDMGQSWDNTWYYPRIYNPPARGFGPTSLLSLTYPYTGGTYHSGGTGQSASGGPWSAFDAGSFALHYYDDARPWVCFGYRGHGNQTILPDGTKRVYYMHPETATTLYIDILPADRNKPIREKMLQASGLSGADFLNMAMTPPR